VGRRGLLHPLYAGLLHTSGRLRDASHRQCLRDDAVKHLARVTRLRRTIGTPDIRVVLGQDSGKIKFVWFKADGQKGEVAIELADKSFVWGFDVPENKVTVRFSEKLTEKGNWLEIGEVTRDGGASWFKFFEMELSKVK